MSVSEVLRELKNLDTRKAASPDKLETFFWNWQQTTLQNLHHSFLIWVSIVKKSLECGNVLMYFPSIKEESHWMLITSSQSQNIANSWQIFFQNWSANYSRTFQKLTSSFLNFCPNSEKVQYSNVESFRQCYSGHWL